MTAIKKVVRMKIFIDSADIDEIKKAFEWGICDGVTTNPSLIKKAAAKHNISDMKEYITKILQTAKGTPVSLEVTEISYEGMLRQAKKLFSMFNPVANNVYIKIPVNPAFKDEDNTHFDGIRVIRELSKENIPVNCTLIFTPEQAMLAAKAGAKFVSPFAGRIDDSIRDNAEIEYKKDDYFPAEGWEAEEGGMLDDNGIVSGIDLVGQCTDIIQQYGYETEVLAASLRNTRQVRESALIGADIATLPFGVIKQMLKHFKTYEGMDKFTKDIVPEYAELAK